MVTITFSGPPAAYKPNYSRYYFRYYFRCYFCRCFSPYTTRINLAATARTNLAATIYINLAATYYLLPYRGAAKSSRSWSYRPPYYGAARSRSYKRRLQLLRCPILD